MAKAVVIQIECSIELTDINAVEAFQDTIKEAIEILRQQGAAHVVMADLADKDPFEDFTDWHKRTIREFDTKIPQEATYTLDFDP